MPRSGHKQDCQCAVCKNQRTKLLREISEGEIPQVITGPPPVTVGSLLIGEVFTYAKAGVYKKLNNLPYDHYQQKGSVMVMDMGDEGSFTIPSDTVVKPIAKGHAVEKEE